MTGENSSPCRPASIRQASLCDGDIRRALARRITAHGGKRGCFARSPVNRSAIPAAGRRNRVNLDQVSVDLAGADRRNVVLNRVASNGALGIGDRSGDGCGARDPRAKDSEAKDSEAKDSEAKDSEAKDLLASMLAVRTHLRILDFMGVRKRARPDVWPVFLPRVLPGVAPSGRPGGSARKPLRVKGVGDRLAYPWVRSVPLLTFVDPSTPLR